MRSLLTSPLTKGVLGGILGVVVGLVAWHAYTDHVAFHTIVDYLNQHSGAINRLGP